jgi:hypothetical protein
MIVSAFRPKRFRLSLTVITIETNAQLALSTRTRPPGRTCGTPTGRLHSDGGMQESNCVLLRRPDRTAEPTQNSRSHTSEESAARFSYGKRLENPHTLFVIRRDGQVGEPPAVST